MDMQTLREKVQGIIEIFYHSPFKIFYVNSIDGVTFTKPVGIFVSLGITTSPEILGDLRDLIIENSKYNAQIAEITSKLRGAQFMNTLNKIGNPEQYEVYPEKPVMVRDDVIAELRRLKETKDITPNLLRDQSKLSEILHKLDETPVGWKKHSVLKDENGYRIYHKYVNYKRTEDLEYRIGIYVV